MVTITCPKCRTELEVPDHLGGKKVRCPECGERLGTTVLPAEEAPRAARGPSRKDALTREPGRKAPSTPEGRPARRRPDDEDDPPTARRKTSRPSRAAAPRSSSAGLVIGLVVGGAALLLLLAGGGGLAWWLAARPPEPNNNGPEPVAVFQPAAAAAADNKPPEPATEFNLAEGRKGVVFIKCINPGVGTGVGSGFLATKDGLVYTNHHVIEPDGPGGRILVGVPSPKNIEELDYFAASVVSTPGPGNAPDFAVLKIAAKPDYGAFQPLPLAGDKDRPPALGDKVAVLGYPFIKRDQPVFSFNKGAVSATKVDLDGKSFYQTDAAVNPGNSGGPLVNAEGKVVGIVTAKKQNANNMGYALYLSETCAAAETAVARAPGVHPEPGPGDFKAVAAAGAIAPKAANYEVVAGKGVEAKNRLEIDGDGGHYWLALKEPLPPNFQVVMQVAVEFLQGRQRVYVSQRQLLRTLCVRFGTDDVRADILEHAGRLIQYTHSRLMYWNANEAMSAGNDGSPDEPFILTITRVADQTVMSVNGRVVLNVRDGRALTGKHRLCVGGFLSRLHLGEVAVTDLGDGKGVKLPPAPPPRAVSPDPGPAIGRGPGPGPAPKPGDTRKAEDVAVKDIAYPADGLPVSACWSADGKAVFVVDARGGVRRFAADTLKEEAKADLALKPSWLSLSAAGLLVTAPDTQKLHVLDPQTLKTTATIDVPRMTRVVSAPGLSVAVGAGQLVPLLVIDLKAGKALKEYSGKDFGKLEVAAFDSVAMTPDGKYAFASTQDGMHRFRVAGGTIEYEDSTYPGVRGSGAFASVFCDEGYACVPSGGGNMSPPKDHPAQGNYQCFVYPVADLKKPAFTLKGAAHWAVAFDHKRGVAYSTTGGAEVSLVAFNTSGLLVKQYRLGVGSVKQVVRQPQGDKLVLLTDKAAAVVDLSKTAGKPSDPGGPEPAKLAGGAARKVDDVTVAELAGPPGSLPAYGCWSADGKTIYLMDGRGTVRRVAADGLKEEATAALALNAAWLALSAEGIVVTAPDTQMLYLLDAQTLKTKAKIEAPGVTRVVSAPGLGVAVGVGGNRPLSLFDLKAGKATGEYGGKDAAGRECRSFDAIAMPPGGKYLFASNGPALLRFLVEDGKLVYEETSYDIRNTGAGFDGIACDDGYAALPCGGGNNAVDKDHPAPKVYQTYVYPVTNLRKPILGLAGAYRIAFDHAHETIYGTTGGAEVNLVKYSAGGATLKEYKLGVGTVQQVIVQLQGEKVLLLTDKTTAVVGLPKK